MFDVADMSHIISVITDETFILHLGPNVITDRTLLCVGSKCYYRWEFYYSWVQMLLQVGPLLHLGSVIILVPSTLFSKVRL